MTSVLISRVRHKYPSVCIACALTVTYEQAMLMVLVSSRNNKESPGWHKWFIHVTDMRINKLHFDFETIRLKIFTSCSNKRGGLPLQGRSLFREDNGKSTEKLILTDRSRFRRPLVQQYEESATHYQFITSLLHAVYKLLLPEKLNKTFLAVEILPCGLSSSGK